MKKLLIDLDLYSNSRYREFGCSYFYHSDNKGVRSLIELVTYAIICRKCELAACIESCPNEALGRDAENKILQKYNMKCTNCKSCVNSCPFGTIYPEMMTYLVPRCDACIDRLAGEETPACAKDSPEGVIKYGEYEEDKEKNIYQAAKNILVKAEHWELDGLPKKTK